MSNNLRGFLKQRSDKPYQPVRAIRPKDQMTADEAHRNINNAIQRMVEEDKRFAQFLESRRCDNKKAVATCADGVTALDGYNEPQVFYSEEPSQRRSSPTDLSDPHQLNVKLTLVLIAIVTLVVVFVPIYRIYYG